MIPHDSQVKKKDCRMECCLAFAMMQKTKQNRNPQYVWMHKPGAEI